MAMRNAINFETLEGILQDSEPMAWGVAYAHSAFIADPSLEEFSSSRVLDLFCYARGGVRTFFPWIIPDIDSASASLEPQPRVPPCQTYDP